MNRKVENIELLQDDIEYIKRSINFRTHMIVPEYVFSVSLFERNGLEDEWEGFSLFRKFEDAVRKAIHGFKYLKLNGIFEYMVVEKTPVDVDYLPMLDGHFQYFYAINPVNNQLYLISQMPEKHDMFWICSEETTFEKYGTLKSVNIYFTEKPEMADKVAIYIKNILQDIYDEEQNA